MNSFKTKLFLSTILSLCLVFTVTSEEEFVDEIKPMDGDLLLPEGYNNMPQGKTAKKKK